jgi:hypothetical protein
LFFYHFENLQGLQSPPAKVVEHAAEIDIIIDIVSFKLIDHVLAEIYPRYPAVLDILEPLLVLTVV